MWEVVLPMLSMWWPVVVVVAAIAILVFSLRFVVNSSKAQNALSIIVASEAAILAVFGEKSEDIFRVLKQIQEAISDGNLTVEEAQNISSNILQQALKRLDLELSVTHLAILNFVVKKMIEAIVCYGKDDEVSDIVSSMSYNVGLAKLEVAMIESRSK